MKILCLDLSTHCGYAVFEGEMGQKPQLLEYGTLHLNKSVHEFGPYPYNYYETGRAVWNMIYGAAAPVCLIQKFVIEETNGGRNRYTQKLLENIHTAVVQGLVSVCTPFEQQIVYLDSSQWRSNLGLKMTKEQKKANAKLSKAKRQAVETGISLDKKKIGVKGRLTPKHLSVDNANLQYGLKLKMKDNDAADAINLGLAYFNNAVHCDGL